MTRAKQSLSLFAIDGLRNRYVAEASGDATVERRLEGNSAAAKFAGIRSEVISLEDIWIDFAANLRAGEARLQALREIDVGDAVSLVAVENDATSTQTVELRNQGGVPLARLSKRGSRKWAPRLPSILSARVIGVHMRLQTDGESRGQSQPALRPEWEIPICEAFFREQRGGAT